MFFHLNLKILFHIVQTFLDTRIDTLVKQHLNCSKNSSTCTRDSIDRPFSALQVLRVGFIFTRKQKSKKISIVKHSKSIAVLKIVEKTKRSIRILTRTVSIWTIMLFRQRIDAWKETSPYIKNNLQQQKINYGVEF